MKLEITLCHSTLMSMLLMPEEFQRAVSSYTATAPDMDGEGFNGYMEVKASFNIRDLEAFASLHNKALVYPSERVEWYGFVKHAMKNYDGKL